MTRYAICIDNEGKPASLELGKRYEIIPDEREELHGAIRVVDETGEDYYFDRARFEIVEESI